MKLILEEFRSWLGSKERTAPVGHGCSPRSCPIAEYIKSKENIFSVWVHDDPIISYAKTIVNHFDYIDNPWWVRYFIRTVDREVIGGIVKAQEALCILATVETQLGRLNWME